MKTFAQMTEAERRYEVGQILAEARCRGYDLRQVLIALVWKFAESGIEPPADLMGWLTQCRATVH